MTGHAVVQYLRNQKERSDAPHPGACRLRSKPTGRQQHRLEGRALNQRVDVKVLVNKGLNQGM